MELVDLYTVSLPLAAEAAVGAAAACQIGLTFETAAAGIQPSGS